MKCSQWLDDKHSWCKSEAHWGINPSIKNKLSNIYVPIDKWLSHHLFTVESWVRIPLGIQNISKVKVREEADLNKRMFRKFSLKMCIY